MAKLCEGYGHRVQQSVFEITCSDAELLTLLHGARQIIAESDDSVSPGGYLRAGSALRAAARGRTPRSSWRWRSS
ncbi:CRISPR-associated endonuclease Cas2 [Microbispora bryophytorum]|nr:CRISPR-associated endonuclease Cas2 [Microbispora bryophytorum]TQS01999.1 CRISPR-associated endonuclease Cas2 [Microbispora bryophytorum]